MNNKEYQASIIKILKKIKNKDSLRRIWDLVTYLYTKEANT